METYDFVQLTLLAMGGEIKGKTKLQKMVYFSRPYDRLPGIFLATVRISMAHIRTMWQRQSIV